MAELYLDGVFNILLHPYVLDSQGLIYTTMSSKRAPLM